VKGWKKALRRFQKDAPNEKWVIEQRGPASVRFDRVAGRLPPLRKRSRGGDMSNSVADAPLERKLRKARRALKRARKGKWAARMVACDLDPDTMDDGAITSFKKAWRAAKTAVTSGSGAVTTPAAPAIDPVLAKSVLPGPDRDAAQGALEAIRKALAAPRLGDGWR
jgi:hypothetical protein